MEAQQRYAQISQWVVLVVLLATLLVGGLGGYVVRGADNAGTQATDGGHTLVIPRTVREGYEITPFQAPAPRWTHEDDVPGSATK